MNRFIRLSAVGMSLLLLYPVAGAQQVPGAKATQEAAAVSQDYVLGPEDVFSVTVLRHPEFSDEYLVPQTGVVQIRAVGSLAVAGLSLANVHNQVLHKLRDRLRNPEVSVSLKVARMQRVFVLGEVKDPGVFNLKEGWGIPEGLSAAGGVLPGLQMQDCTVILERAGGGERTRIPLDEALNGPNKDRVTLKPGDILRVQSLSSIPVFITGKVKVPGQYRLREDSTGILEALAQSGGVVDGAALTSVKILRITGEEEIVDLSTVLAKDSAAEAVATANGAKSASPTKLPRLNGGDIVLVPESLDRFAILGYVSKPGFYSLPSGRRFTLTEALAAAEGANNRGRISRIGLVRTENGKEVRRIYDLGKYLKGGDEKQNPEIFAGDVLYIPESNRVDLTTVLSGVSSTALFFNAIRR